MSAAILGRNQTYRSLLTKIHRALSKSPTFRDTRLIQSTAEAFLAQHLRIRPIDLFLRADRSVPRKLLKGISANLERVASGTPKEHLSGRASFFGYSFAVGVGCAVPKAETEILVKTLLTVIDAIKQNGNEPIRILDLGTGCANIPVAAIKSRFDRHIIVDAVDSNPAALAWARKNIYHHGLQDRIRLFQGNWLECAELIDEKYHLIISNPPYKPNEEAQVFSALRGEPFEALGGGEDGLDYYRRLVLDAPRHLFPQGNILVELPADQRQRFYREIIPMLEGGNPWKSMGFVFPTGAYSGVFLAGLGEEFLPIPPRFSEWPLIDTHLSRNIVSGKSRKGWSNLVLRTLIQHLDVRMQELIRLQEQVHNRYGEKQKIKIVRKINDLLRAVEKQRHLADTWGKQGEKPERFEVVRIHVQTIDLLRKYGEGFDCQLGTDNFKLNDLICAERFGDSLLDFATVLILTDALSLEMVRLLGERGDSPNAWDEPKFEAGYWLLLANRLLRKRAFFIDNHFMSLSRVSTWEILKNVLAVLTYRLHKVNGVRV